MSATIKILGLVNGQPTEHDGRYLALFSLECEPGTMVLDTVEDPADAQVFPSAKEAFELWKTVDPRAPVRRDGKPNRPFTAFTIQVHHG